MTKLSQTLPKLFKNIRETSQRLTNSCDEVPVILCDVGVLVLEYKCTMDENVDASNESKHVALKPIQMLEQHHNHVNSKCHCDDRDRDVDVQEPIFEKSDELHHRHLHLWN